MHMHVGMWYRSGSECVCGGSIFNVALCVECRLAVWGQKSVYVGWVTCMCTRVCGIHVGGCMFEEVL